MDWGFWLATLVMPTLVMVLGVLVRLGFGARAQMVGGDVPLTLASIDGAVSVAIPADRSAVALNVTFPAYSFAVLLALVSLVVFVICVFAERAVDAQKSKGRANFPWIRVVVSWVLVAAPLVGNAALFVGLV